MIVQNDITNNGKVNGIVSIRSSEFTNNSVDGINEIRLEDNGSFINKADIHIADLYIGDNSSMDNRANISFDTVAFEKEASILGTVNNTGNITFDMRDESKKYTVGFNKDLITGNPIEITYNKTLDYSKRVFNTGVGFDYEINKGLMFYANDIEIYNNIYNSEKREYNVVGEASDNDVYLELALDSTAVDTSIVEYEFIDFDNLQEYDEYTKGFTLYQNRNVSVYTVGGDDILTNYLNLIFVNDSKPGYFKYKIKGFTDGEEILVQGALNTSDVLTALYESNGGSYVRPGFASNADILTAPTTPTKTGYKFMGWYTDEELTNKIDFADPLTENVVLYAKWEAETPNPQTYDAGVTMYLIISLLCILSIYGTTKYYIKQN